MTKLHWWTKLLVSVVLFGGGSFTFSRGAAAGEVDDALSNDTAIAQGAMTALRNSGPQGLAAVLQRYDQSDDERLLPVIDAVAAQRDAIWSRLYWYTDLDRAKAAAQAEHKPILYLRLMGKLTDEYSCANSRFFRTVLYANYDVSKMLREQFVLVWGSERPVPFVTINYGDGRVLKRTLTGNSIHYVLTPQGKVIDALPGLYAPQTFSRILGDARIEALSSQRFGEMSTVDYPARTGDSLLRSWSSDSLRVVAPATAAIPKFVTPYAAKPAAIRAMPLAASKCVVEMPLLAGISPQYVAVVDRSIDAADSVMWRKVANLHLAEAKLDPSSIGLLKSKNPAAYAQGDLLQRTVQLFESQIALDTVHNNYEFRRKILGWLKESKGMIELEDLNSRVYSELFLTPRSDPWLGLVPDATYTALPDDGEPSTLPVTPAKR
jgi:hypothetical protein